MTNTTLRNATVASLLGVIASTSISYASSFIGNSTMSYGSRGQDVAALQIFLANKGFFNLPSHATYGYFGSLTRNALSSYQSSVGIQGDGMFDTSTRDKVNSEISGDQTMMTPTTDTKAAGLRVLLNSINREHANLASIALRKGFDGAADFNASYAALDKNSVEVGKSIGSVYGSAAETQFLEIWRSHITYFVNYTLAVKANDQVKKDQAVSDLASYVNRVSTFLSQANPNLPYDAVHQIVTEHVRLLRSTIDKHFAGNYDASYMEQHATDVQIGTVLADTVAGAIVKQYPERFK